MILNPHSLQGEDEPLDTTTLRQTSIFWQVKIGRKCLVSFEDDPSGEHDYNGVVLGFNPTPQVGRLMFVEIEGKFVTLDVLRDNYTIEILFDD